MVCVTIVAFGVDMLLTQAINGVTSHIKRVMDESVPKVLHEPVYLFAAGYVVEKVAKYTFGFGTIPYLKVVIAPIAEEIIFRTIIQGGMKKLQDYSFKWIRGRDATVAEQEAQRLFRVRVTGVLFGLAHWGNFAGKPVAVKVAFTALITFGGITLSYLKEATGSTAPCILAHSVHNAILDLKISALAAIISCYTIEIATYLWAKMTINEAAADQLAGRTCVQLA